MIMHNQYVWFCNNNYIINDPENNKIPCFNWKTNHYAHQTYALGRAGYPKYDNIIVHTQCYNVNYLTKKLKYLLPVLPFSLTEGEI